MKLNKIFTEGSELPATETRDSNIKVESTFHSANSREEPSCSRAYDSPPGEEDQNQDENHYTLYAQRNFQQRDKQPIRPFPPRFPANPNSPNNKTNWRPNIRKTPQIDMVSLQDVPSD